MLKNLRKLVRAPATQSCPAIPAGQRVYAIGDIHGRRDLFEPLVAAIEADDARRGSCNTTIILLGDLVDRGPDSAGVIDLARNLAARRKVRIIFGNHEELFLDAMDDQEVLRAFLRYGGRETVLSYPVRAAAWNAATLDEAQAMMVAAVPQRDIDFIRTFEDAIVIGDYLFVHAGITPGVPIEAQGREALRWIREPFLSHDGDHGFCVVHGHTITDEVEVRGNRMGIDTGAYRSGRLTALGLEGQSRWLITAQESEGSISCRTQTL